MAVFLCWLAKPTTTLILYRAWNRLFIKGIGPPQLVWEKGFDVVVFVVIISNLQDLNIIL
jgi:hypothetical protein